MDTYAGRWRFIRTVRCRLIAGTHSDTSTFHNSCTADAASSYDVDECDTNRSDTTYTQS